MGTSRNLQLILQLKKALVTQPCPCHLLGSSLQQEARREYFADSHTEPNFISSHHTRFFIFGVGSVELEMRKLILNVDDPPVYLRHQFRRFIQNRDMVTGQELP